MKYRKRDLLEILKKEIEDPRISLILGARQVGKTCLLKLLCEEYSGQKAYFDLELPEILEILQATPRY